MRENTAQATIDIREQVRYMGDITYKHPGCVVDLPRFYPIKRLLWETEHRDALLSTIDRAADQLI